MIRSKKASWLTVGIVALVFLMAGVAHAASSTSADEAAIRAQAASWEKAYNGGDAKGVAALYARTPFCFRRVRRACGAGPRFWNSSPRTSLPRKPLGRSLFSIPKLMSVSQAPWVGSQVRTR